MKRSTGMAGLLAAAALLLCALATGVHHSSRNHDVTQARIIRVAADPQLDGGRAVGFATGKGASAYRYMMHIAGLAGVRFQFVPTGSPTEAYRQLQSGKVDLVPSVMDLDLPQDDRFLVSPPYFEGRTLLFSRAAGPGFATLGALAGHVVAVREGSQYVDWIRRHHPDIKVLEFTGVPQILGAVESGTADAALGTDALYNPVIRRYFQHTLVASGAVAELPIVVRAVVRREDKALLDTIDSGLRALSVAHHRDVIDGWLETVYRTPPSVGAILLYYRTEAISAALVLLALAFAAYQMKRSRDLAKRAAQEKARMLAVVSHEIRNSANALLSATDLLGKGPVLPEQEEALDAALASASSLSLLLNNALEYSRFEGGSRAAEPTRVALRPLIEESVRAFRPQARERNVTCHVELPCGEPGDLWIDPIVVRQVVANLLSNAIKFTRNGDVRVRLWVEAGTSGHCTLNIEVIDSGIGMSAEERDALFSDYWQSQQGRALGGAGLGLSICSRITQRLGGSIQVESSPGKGSRFHVVLPARHARACEPSAPTLALQQQATATHGNPSVLIVEDHIYSARMFKAQIEAMGLSVTLATDAAHALRVIRTAPQFGSILLDCNLPDMDGYALCRRIRAIEHSRRQGRASILAISAMEGVEHAKECAEAGFDHVVTKPLSTFQLRAWLGRGPGDEIARGMLEIFWESYDSDLQDLQVAVEAGVWGKASDMAHRICGSAAIAGERGIEAIARALMPALRQRTADPASASDIARLIEDLRWYAAHGTRMQQAPLAAAPCASSAARGRVPVEERGIPSVQGHPQD